MSVLLVLTTVILTPHVLIFLGTSPVAVTMDTVEME